MITLLIYRKLIRVNIGVADDDDDDDAYPRGIIISIINYDNNPIVYKFKGHNLTFNLCGFKYY